MDEALQKLLINLKHFTWGNGAFQFRIDENEGRAIIKSLEELREKELKNKKSKEKRRK